MIYMDIDYMEEYKDFTVNEERFGGFKEFVREMKGQDIRLIPIIDAGVKIEEGYPVYEEGIREGYFCTKEDGTPYGGSMAGVYPFSRCVKPEGQGLVWGKVPLPYGYGD